MKTLGKNPIQKKKIHPSQKKGRNKITHLFNDIGFVNI